MSGTGVSPRLPNDVRAACTSDETGFHSAKTRRTVGSVSLGTNAFDAEHGLTTPHPDEAAVKRAMVKAGALVVLLADSSKAGRLDLHRFASFEQVDVLVTDSGMDDAAVRAVRARDVEVVIA